MDYTFDPTKETVAQNFARTQSAINANNPNETPLPTTLPGETPALPATGGASSPLLSFADALNAAVNLAREHRNKSSLDMMKPFQGTVAASDFGGILGNLNAASDKTSENLIKHVTDIQTPDASGIVTATNDAGDVTAIDKATGKVLWTAKGVGNKQTGSATPKLTAAERAANALAQFGSAFVPGATLSSGVPVLDSTGFATPDAWKAAIADAPAEGLSRAEFIKQFGYLITAGDGTVSLNYGLTPAELKLIDATARQ